MYDNDSKNKEIERLPAISPTALSELLAKNGFNSPELFVQQIDLVAGKAAVLRLSRQAYRAASFLDTRVLALAPDGFIMPHDHLVAWTQAITDAARPIHFMFHAGHVGSTLLSRMIEEANGVLCLREPPSLRTLAAMHDTLSGAFSGDRSGGHPSASASNAFDVALTTQVRLWRRGYDDTHCVVVKTTSDTARIGERLMREAPEARAVLLNVAAEVFLVQTLSSSMSDLQSKGRERFGRLLRMLGAVGPVTTRGEAAAMSWLAEQLTQQRIAKACPGRTLSIDFDAFLADPDLALKAILQHFALRESAAKNKAAHALMRQYAKNPDEHYSTEMRAARLRQSRNDNGEEIRRGLAWLDAMAAAHPSAAAARAA